MSPFPHHALRWVTPILAGLGFIAALWFDPDPFVVCATAATLLVTTAQTAFDLRRETTVEQTNVWQTNVRQTDVRQTNVEQTHALGDAREAIEEAAGRLAFLKEETEASADAATASVAEWGAIGHHIRETLTLFRRMQSEGESLKEAVHEEARVLDAATARAAAHRQVMDLIGAASSAGLDPAPLSGVSEMVRILEKGKEDLLQASQRMDRLEHHLEGFAHLNEALQELDADLQLLAMNIAIARGKTVDPGLSHGLELTANRARKAAIRLEKVVYAVAELVSCVQEDGRSGLDHSRQAGEALEQAKTHATRFAEAVAGQEDLGKEHRSLLSKALEILREQASGLDAVQEENLVVKRHVGLFGEKMKAFSRGINLLRLQLGQTLGPADRVKSLMNRQALALARCERIVRGAVTEKVRPEEERLDLGVEAMGDRDQLGTLGKLVDLGEADLGDDDFERMMADAIDGMFPGTEPEVGPVHDEGHG